MTSRLPLEPGKKLGAAIGVAAVAVSLVIGLTHPPNMRAQAPPPDRPTAAVRRRLGQDGRQSGCARDPAETVMLQSLLMDRFKMVVHRVTKDAGGYALTVAKNGPKMQEAKEGKVPGLPDWIRGPSDDPAKLEELVVATMPAPGVGAITGRRVTMLQFTEKLQRLLDTAVLDQTGLDGKYYFALQYATGDTPDAPLPDLFSAVKQLGLRLEKHKGPVEMLVVDHIEKFPTEN